MVNPANQTNTTIPEETYNILNKIKQEKNCTFDELLDQLCELEFQHNYVERVQRYELDYNDVVFPFQITFKKNNMVINYETPAHESSTKISEWGVPDKVQKEFYTFISEEHSRCILEHMPLGLVFKDFDIYKIG